MQADTKSFKSGLYSVQLSMKCLDTPLMISIGSGLADHLIPEHNTSQKLITESTTALFTWNSLPQNSRIIMAVYTQDITFSSDFTIIM